MNNLLIFDFLCLPILHYLCLHFCAWSSQGNYIPACLLPKWLHLYTICTNCTLIYTYIYILADSAALWFIIFSCPLFTFIRLWIIIIIYFVVFIKQCGFCGGVKICHIENAKNASRVEPSFVWTHWEFDNISTNRCSTWCDIVLSRRKEDQGTSYYFSSWFHLF